MVDDGPFCVFSGVSVYDRDASDDDGPDHGAGQLLHVLGSRPGGPRLQHHAAGVRAKVSHPPAKVVRWQVHKHMCRGFK